MSPTGSHEVCVIGGGPAGSSIAHKLALLGHEVCLVERSAFPRPHVGESLASGVLPLLDALGLRGHIEAAGFLRPEGTVLRWGEDRGRFVRRTEDLGLLVDRSRFDAMLLDGC